MREKETKINNLIKYCPICNREHNQNVIQREVHTTLSGREVKYREILYKCIHTDYETVITRDLKEIMEDKEEIMEDKEKSKIDDIEKPQWETCFGFNGKSACKVLTEMVCLKKKCNFYKTLAEFEKQAKKYD